jgi:AcrR family transcriptional regulator
VHPRRRRAAYADRGFADITLREVAAANINLAAVNYHFGSRTN